RHTRFSRDWSSDVCSSDLSWGDGRLTVLGTEGYMEIRKNIDIAGRDGGNHLFLVNNKETKYIDCSQVPLPYGSQLVDDVVNRTEIGRASWREGGAREEGAA